MALVMVFFEYCENFVNYAWQLEFRFNSNFHLISISVPGKTTQVKVNMLIRSMGPISEMKMVKIRTHFLYLTFKIFEFCGNVWQALKEYFFTVLIQNCDNLLEVSRTPKWAPQELKQHIGDLMFNVCLHLVSDYADSDYVYSAKYWL